MSGHLSAWEALHLNDQMGKAEPTPAQMTDHELRWALRESIDVMYKHLGIEPEEE